MSKAEIMMGGIALASITTNPAISSIVIILSSVSALIAIYFFRGFASEKILLAERTCSYQSADW